MIEEDSESSPSSDEFSLEAIPLHSTDLLTVLSEEGVIKYESPAIERIFGYDQNELVGEQVADYFHPDDREQVQEAFQNVVVSERYTEEAVEFRHRVADGSYRWVESISSSSTAPDGSYIVNTRDISERKRREQELEQKNKRLDRFASVISHDLRNPLNVAALRLNLAHQECDSEHLDDVERAHNRMERLIDDLLALARSKTQIRETEPLDLERVVERCWQNVSTAEATLVTDVEQSIQADCSQLEQLFENLIRNAVEHGSESRDTANVSVVVGDLDDGFYVADNGPGVPVEQRPGVFESGHTTKRDGTGLGLAIVEVVVTAHDWEITITESDSGGARFEITGVDSG